MTKPTNHSVIVHTGFGKGVTAPVIYVKDLGNEDAPAALLQAYGGALLFSAESQDLRAGIEALMESLGLWRTLGIKWSRAGGTAHAYLRKGEWAEALACAGDVKGGKRWVLSAF